MLDPRPRGGPHIKRAARIGRDEDGAVYFTLTTVTNRRFLLIVPPTDAGHGPDIYGLRSRVPVAIDADAASLPVRKGVRL